MNKKSSNKNKSLNKNEKENKIASIISIILTLGLCLSVSIIVLNIKSEKYIREHRYDSIEEGYILIPSGLIYSEDSDMLKNIVINTLTSTTVDSSTKKKLQEYLDDQQYDYSFIHKDSINTDLMTSEEQDKYIEFLKEQGIIGDEYNIETTEDGLSTINGKKALSFKTLHEAESSFGTNLRLYTYIDCLENYEMINAYTVGNDFLQCVYAINQDGTMIEDSQDIENSDIRTLTVKLSKTIKSDELIKVYESNNYNKIGEIVQDGVQVNLFGRDSNLVNLAYCDRDDGRSYVFHCADGIEEWQIREIINELFNNLYIESLDDTQKQIYLDNYSNENAWYNK